MKFDARMIFLLRHSRGYRAGFLSALLFTFLAAVLAFAGPLILRTYVDSVLGSDAVQAPNWLMALIQMSGGLELWKQAFWIPGIFLLFFTLGSGIASFFSGKIAAQSSEGFAKKLRETMYDHLQRLPFSYHVKAETGDLIQRCTSDVETIRRFLGIQAVEIGRAISLLIIAVPVLMSIHVRLSLISLSVVPLILTASVIFFIWIQRSFKVSDEAEGAMSTVLQENLSGVRVVRAFGRERFEIDRFAKSNGHYRDVTYRLILLFAYFWMSSDFLSLFQTGTALVVGSYFAFLGEISTGELLVFLTYLGMLLWPVRMLGRILADMGKALVAASRLDEVLQEKTEDLEEKGEKPAIHGAITFEKVSFSYGEHRVLKDISFSVEPGETLAILGPTGSGKSTLVHLLPRLYEVNSGRIMIDGNDISRINKHWIREHVGIVLQEPFLFAKTIGSNIGISGSTSAEIEEAASIACFHEVVNDFDRGYSTMVGERGVTLSGGQKQRLAIARAIVRDCPILIFDDSLSAVDTETDEKIREALASRKNRVTTILISHRVSTLSAADKILVLEDGRISQLGNHKELIAAEGMYKRIWDLQNNLEEDLVKDLA
jgi:ATP-binding cassette subfamily B protein